MTTYELNLGPMTKVRFGVTKERFSVQTIGGVGGQALDLRLSSINHFCVEPLPRPRSLGPRALVVKAAQAYAGNGNLVLSWNERGRKRSRRLLARIDDPSFKALVLELKRLRPDASLFDLPLN